ncbi:MAG: hypothetical protein JXB62_09480 [Pirellulales bacterium]|nr:hypothetical protein [Pirellulales bacterium]
MSELLAKCEVCQSLLDEEDMFCANCGTEAPRRKEQPERPADDARLATYNFECSGCGASMSFDATAGSLQCPFCASVDMVQQKDARILAPKRVVPFRLDRDEAVAAMRRWLGRGFFRPGNLSQQASVVQMRAVYVPYWVFQATTHTHWTADTSQTPRGARGDWYPLSGEHRGTYSNLLIGASGALSPGETSNICPFNLAEGVPPGEVDLENVTVEQFSVPRKYARPLARAGLEQLETQACDQAYVPGRSRNVHVNLRIEALSSEPVLLPVWIMAYRYRDRLFRFLVNGQTGQATGHAPFSWLKILMIPAIIIAVALALLLCSGIVGAVGGLGRNTPTDRPPAISRPIARPVVPPDDSPSLCYTRPNSQQPFTFPGPPRRA